MPWTLYCFPFLPHFCLLLICIFQILYSLRMQSSLLAATFYGAYQRLRPSASDTEFNLGLSFRNSVQTGLILAVRLDQGKSNAGYIAVGIQHNLLVAQIFEDGTPNNRSVGTLEPDTWYRLVVRMVSTNITVDLIGESTQSINYTLSSLLTVRDAFVGGANSFFAPAFSTLNLTEYFTGCLANATLNSRAINLAPKQEGYGFKSGCCPDAEPVVWCYEGPEQNFSFDSRLAHRRFSHNYRRLSFRIQANGEGMVFYSHNEDNSYALAVELYEGHLLVHLTNGLSAHEPHTLNCSGRITDRWWHSVHVTLRSDSLECSIDGTSSRLNSISSTLFTNSLEYSFGSAEVPTPNTALQLFQSSLKTLPQDGRFPAFRGCLQKVQLNGLDITPSSFSRSSPATPLACSSSDGIDSCELLQAHLSQMQLLQVSVEATDTSVEENGKRVLTAEHLILRLPNTITNTEVRTAIASTIQFTVTHQLKHGQFSTTLDYQQPIQQFSYEDILNRTIVYHHNGDEFDTDDSELEVSSTCTREFSQRLPIHFTVNLTNDTPRVVLQNALSLAVGTRRAITENVLLVEDENADALTIFVNDIQVDDCQDCGAPGQIERYSSPKIPYPVFTQREIGNGDITFQHFAEFGMRPITIHLSISDSSNAAIDVSLSVIPYVGHLNLTLNEPLFVVRGHCSNITSKHLNSTADFADQNRLLSMDI